MNSNNFKYIFFIITIILGLESIAWSKINSQIIFKIDGSYSPNKKMLIKSIFFMIIPLNDKYAPL